MTRLLLLSALLWGTVTVAQAQAPEPARAHATAVAGPRLAPAWPRYEAPLQHSQALDAKAAADLNDQHTVILSTLSLILIGVIVVLLVTR